METTTEPATVLAFVTRKPGTTAEEFRTYYETKHIPLIMELVFKGDNIPLSYTRNYVDRSTDSSGTAPAFPLGGADTWKYDCVTRFVFRDVAHRNAAFGVYKTLAGRIAEDEDKFLDRSKLIMIFATDSPSHLGK